MKRLGNRTFSCVCEPIDDPSVDDANVPIRSVLLKNIVLGLVLIAIATSTVLITVCATTDARDLRWPVALGASLIIWLVVLLVSVGLFLSHPYYAEWLLKLFQWKRIPVATNPLLEPEDQEISFDE